MEDHYFSTSHPHSNNSSSNQYAFTVTTPSSLSHSDSGALHSPGSILASTTFASAIASSFTFTTTHHHHHPLYQIDEKKQANQLQHQNHPYPPSSMLSPLSSHLGLGSPASTRAASSDVEDDLQRKKALNRLSLASSIASSAPSTTASEVDGSENGHDYDMGDGQYLNFSDNNDQNQEAYRVHREEQDSGNTNDKDTEMSSIGRSRGSTLSDAFKFQNGDRVPDLVHSRSNATIQARYQNSDRSPLLSPSECTSSHSNVAEFVFSDFIADAEPAEGQGADDQDLQRTLDGAQALSLYSSPAQQQQLDAFATPQRPLRHRDVSHLSAGEPASTTAGPSLQFSGMHQHSHTFNSCPTSPASPLTALPATSFETPPNASNPLHLIQHNINSMGATPSAAAAYAALHRPQFGNAGRSFSFNVIPAHQDQQQAMSGVIHDPHGLFSDRSVGGSGNGNVGPNGVHRASEGGNSDFGAAGLGLFGYAHTRPDSLGRSHSLPGPMFNNEPLSCNPAHITPSASSRSGYGTDRDSSVVSSPAGSLNVSSMVLFDSDGAESPNSPFGYPTTTSPRDFHNESDGDDDEEDMEDRQNTIKSPPTKKQLLKGGVDGDQPVPSLSKSSNIRISAKRLFSSTQDDNPGMSILSASAPSAPAAVSSTSSPMRKTPSANTRSARGTRRSNGLTINSSRSRSPASVAGSPSTSSIYNSSAQASPYLSPTTINYGKIRSVSSSNLPRSPLAGTPASPAESVISAFSSRSSYHSGQEDGSSVCGTPSSSLASASINAEGVITKRSRGRRVPDDPAELNNLGKMGKIYTCQVEGCGKCFKRSEHLKRHVRSIHTDEKPFECPFPTCHKKFSRLDNLNQHSRVHQVPTSGASSTGSISARSSQAGSVSPAFSPHIPSSNSGNSIASSGSANGRRGSAPSSISIKMAGSNSSEGASSGGAQIKRKRGSASLSRDKANQVKQQEEEEGMFALDEEQEDSNADVKPLNLRR